MILICPHCLSRSRVNDGAGHKPMAQVQCGQCSKRFYVSAAFADGQDTSRGPPALIPMGGRTLRQATRPALALLIPLALLALCWWRLRPGFDAHSALSAQISDIAPPFEGALALEQVRVLPYAPEGGAEGLLVQGLVVNRSTATHAFEPRIGVRASPEGSLPEPPAVTAKLSVGPGQTLQGAATLQPEDLEAQQALAHKPVLELAPQQQVPFVGLVPLTSQQARGPWRVRLAWLGAQQSPAQIP